MSWWDTGTEDDVIGDTPADIVGDAFQIIAETRKRQRKTKPTLQEVLDSIVVTLRTNPEHFVEDGKITPLQKIVVVLDSGEKKASSIECASVDNELVSIFKKAFTAIAKAYEERWQRKPRLRELLNCLAFVLGYNPAEFIADAQELNIGDIIAE